VPNKEDKVPADTHTIDELVRRIVDAVQPLRVILFGSAARGAAGIESDIDLLIGKHPSAAQCRFLMGARSWYNAPVANAKPAACGETQFVSHHSAHIEETA
jgi:hypothetical protein